TTVPRTQYILSELQEDGVPEVATWHAVRHLPSREELKYIDFPVDLPLIEPFVFNSCPKLEWINYPDNLEKIGEYAFFDSLNIRGNTCPCSGSSNFSVLDFKNKTALNSIGDKAFANNNSGYGSTRFRSLLLGDDLVTIGDSAFLWNAIGTLSIPKNVRIIGSHAFYKCRLLTTVELEDRTLEDLTIGAYCFSSEFTRVQDKDIYDIRLTNVCEFPSYVVIREACFSSATFLQNYTFAQDTTYIPEGTFRYCKSLQNVFLGTYRLSTGVSRSVQQIEDMGNANAGTPALKEIADQAFANCYSLKQVSLPNSLEKLGSGSFRNCRELEFVRLPDHGSKLTEIPSYAFYSSGLKTIHFPTVGEGDNATSTIRTIGAYAFAEDNNLTHINEESILVDNPDDPNGAKIEVSGLIIPNGIEEIGQYAFMRCTSVQTAAIPRSVKKMGIGVFLGCSSLERIYVGYTEQEVQQLIADGDWDYAWNAGDVKVQYKKEGE
ncbi:MAG: leucine-rich repeat domain-containing protein, partial [Spirochaetales bacterium]|nr:leucine-rich repeat domain-containing protein [Candidatus Physcosoma equi]